MSNPYACSFVMHWFYIYHHITLKWRLRRSCKVMVHGIHAILETHIDYAAFQVDVANAFNTISCKAIFQELWVGKLNVPTFSFCSFFYGFQVFLFFNQHSSSWDFFVIILLWALAKPIHLHELFLWLFVFLLCIIL